MSKEIDDRKKANQQAALTAIHKYAKKWAATPKKDMAMYDWRRVCKAIELAARDGIHGLPVKDMGD